MKKRKWTIEEVEYLKNNVGMVRVSTIAINLMRTETSVLMKMKRLGISNTKAQLGLLTIYELSNLCNVDSATVRRWINYHGLKSIDKITRVKRRCKFICTEDFWAWARNNTDRIDFIKIEPNTIPPEPDWVTPLRNVNSNSNSYKVWSKKEEEQLVSLFDKGQTIDMISRILNRSKISVQRKLYRIRKISH